MSQYIGGHKDSEISIWVLMNAHLGSDEVLSMLVCCNLQDQPLVSHGVVVADGPIFLDAERV